MKTYSKKIRRGQSTHGYGKTIELVKKAFKAGINIREAAKRYNISEAALRSCAVRNNIDIKLVSDRCKYGKVKNAVIKGSELNLTAREIANMFEVKITSVWATARDYKIKIKSTYKNARKA